MKRTVNTLAIRLIILSILAILSSCKGPSYEFEQFSDQKDTFYLSKSTGTPNDNVVIIENADYEESGGTLEIPKDDVGSPLSENDVLVSGITEEHPNGFLYKIDEVTENGDSYNIKVSNAKLTDLFEDLDLLALKPIQMEDIQSIEAVEGISIKKITTHADLSDESQRDYFSRARSVEPDEEDLLGKVEYTFELANCELGDEEVSFHASGELSISMELFLDLEIRKKKLVNLEAFAYVTPRFALNSNVQFHEELPDKVFNRDISEIEIISFKLKPYVIMIGPVPLVLTQELVIKAGLDGEISAEIGFNYTLDKTFTNYLYFEPDSLNRAPYQTPAKYELGDNNAITNDFVPYCKGSAELTSFIGAYYTTKFYGIAGPMIGVEPNIKLEGEYDSGEGLASGSLSFDLLGKVGLSLSFFDISDIAPPFPFNLIKTYEIWSGEYNTAGEFDDIEIDPITGNDIIPPALPANIKISVLNKALNLTWDDPGDEDLCFIKIFLERPEGTVSEYVVFPGEENILFDDLSNGEQYGITIEPYDYTFNRSTSIQFFGTPEKDEIIALSADSNHCLLLLDTGAVYGFGNSVYGELGKPKMSYQYAPTLVYIGDIVDVACGRYSSYLLESDGTLLMSGQASDSGEFEEYAQMDGIIDIDATSDLLCVCTAEGNVYKMNPASDNYNEPRLVEGLEDIIKIEIGGNTLLAYDSQGNLWEVLTDVITGNAVTSRIGDTGSITDFSVNVGWCAVVDSGDSAHIWDDGAFYYGTNALITDIADAKEVATSASTGFILKNNGTLWIMPGKYWDSEYGPFPWRMEDSYQISGFSNIKMIESCDYAGGIIAVDNDNNVWEYNTRILDNPGVPTMLDW